MEKLDARMGKFVERLNFCLDGDIRLESRLLQAKIDCIPIADRAVSHAGR